MCKLNNSILVLILLNVFVINVINSTPLGGIFNDDEYSDEDFDLHYDERQKGTENLRLRIDGVVLGIPASGSSSMGSSTDLFSSLAAEILAMNNENEDEDDNEIQADTDKWPIAFEIPSETSSVKPFVDVSSEKDPAIESSSEAKPLVSESSEKIPELTNSSEVPAEAAKNIQGVSKVLGTERQSHKSKKSKRR